MSYDIRVEETLDKAIKRVVRRELEKAHHSLFANKQTPTKEGFHDARKRLKKVRAALRLVREPLGESVFRHWNSECRDIARLFSEVRDAQVLGDTFVELLDHYETQIASGGFATVQAGIRKLSRGAIRRVQQNKGALKQAGFQIRELIHGVDKLTLGTDGWTGIESGLRRTYRKNRRSFQHAYAAPSDVAFHEWRKSTKYLRHQIELVRQSWESPMRGLCDALHEESDCLGLDHDLVMLREQIARDPERFGAAETIRALFTLIERRQEEIREQAEPLGQRLYVEKTGAFVRRMEGYWQTWHRPAQKPQGLPRLMLSA